MDYKYLPTGSVVINTTTVLGPWKYRLKNYSRNKINMFVNFANMNFSTEQRITKQKNQLETWETVPVSWININKNYKNNTLG
jgi:hypothetical protein